jgi:GTPase SAR1 family protein
MTIEQARNNLLPQNNNIEWKGTGVKEDFARLMQWVEENKKDKEKNDKKHNCDEVSEKMDRETRKTNMGTYTMSYYSS